MRPWLPLFVLSLATGLAGCSSYEHFLQKKDEKYCETQTTCNADIPCDLANGSDTGYSSAVEDCDFDKKAAHDCLHGVWTCADQFPGFEYPIAPQVCNSVCRGATLE